MGRDCLTSSLRKLTDDRKPGSMESSMETATRWYHDVAYFFGGAFLANTIPHLVNGISGSPFQSPFASPPGVGLSSSTVNVLWGMFNLAVAYGAGCTRRSIRPAANEACGRPGTRVTPHRTPIGAAFRRIPWGPSLKEARSSSSEGRRAVRSTRAAKCSKYAPSRSARPPRASHFPSDDPPPNDVPAIPSGLSRKTARPIGCSRYGVVSTNPCSRYSAHAPAISGKESSTIRR
jgi:hypothetical protein